MPGVYDDQKKKADNYIPSDDELRHLTGIGEDEEGAMDREAYNAQANEILAREQAAARGQTKTQTQGVANPDSQIQRGGFGVPKSPQAAAGSESSGVVRGGFGSTKKSQTDLNEAEEDAVGKGYTGNQGKTKKESRLKSKIRKRIIGGSVVGGGGIISLGLLFTSFGPLQRIHASELLQDHDYAAMDDTNDFKAFSLLRYAYYASKGQTERSRLGLVGNKIADKAPARFKAAGLVPIYSSVLGFGEGFKVDRESGSKYSNMTDAEVKEHFKTTYNVDLVEGKNFGATPELNKPGTLVVDMRPGKGMGYFKSGRFMRVVLREVGLNRVTSAILTHITRVRAGLTWHPIKKKVQQRVRATEADYVAWNKDRAEKIKEGTYTRPTVQASQGDEKTPPEQKAAAQAAAEAGTTTVNEGAATAEALKTGSVGAMAKFQATINNKWAAGGLAAATIPCILRGIDANANNIKEAQVVLPLMRMGGEAISVGEQTKSGVDMTGDLLGFYDRLGTGPDANGKVTTWTDGRVIQTISGNPGGGVQANKTLRTIPEGTPFHFLNENPYDIPLDAFCNPLTQTAILIIQFAGAPVVTVLSVLAGDLILTPILDEGAKWMAGNAVDINEPGAAYGNNIGYGSRLASNEQALATGGAPVTKEAEQRIDNGARLVQEEEFKSKSLAYRLFNPRDYRTPVARFIDRQSTQSITHNLASLTNSFLGVGDSFGGSLATAVSGGKAYAAGSTYYDYGFTRIAIDPAIAGRPEYANPYETGERAVNVLESSIGQSLIDKSKRCKGVILAKNGAGLWDATSSAEARPLSRDAAADECKTSSDKNWELISEFINSTTNANALACKLVNDAEGCQSAGLTNPNATSAGTGVPIGGGGDPKAIAAAIWAKANGPNPQIRFQTNGGKTAFEQIVNTGAQQACGTTVQISPELLNVILKASETYLIVLGVFAAGHGCDGGYHPKGMAVDINGVAKGGVTTGNFFHINEMNAAQLNLAREFYSHLSNVSPVKTGGLGQSQCFRPLPPLSPNVSFFPDECNHLHYDVRKNQ